MSSRPVRLSLALACLALLGACGSDDGAVGDAVHNTELNAILLSSGPSPVVSVEYSVTCVGDEDFGVSDPITFDGDLEPENGRAAKIGILETVSETWTDFLDLPPGACSIQLRARDDDGEVICDVRVSFSVGEDVATQVVVPLECNSPGYPRAGNTCPDLLALSCEELDPVAASTSCHVRFRDSDDTCGPGCDPQTCTATAEGLTCTPGPDPGVVTTITCTDALLDCTGDGALDSSCVIDTNSANTFPEFREASFFVACIPQEPDATLGTTITCTAVTSDGDLDCDKTKVITIDCPVPGL